VVALTSTPVNAPIEAVNEAVRLPLDRTIFVSLSDGFNVTAGGDTPATALVPAVAPTDAAVLAPTPVTVDVPAIAPTDAAVLAPTPVTVDVPAIAPTDAAVLAPTPVTVDVPAVAPTDSAVLAPTPVTVDVPAIAPTLLTAVGSSQYRICERLRLVGMV
jgi:hypothetical protein